MSYQVPTLAEQYTILNLNNKKQIKKLIKRHKVYLRENYTREGVTLITFRDDSQLRTCKGKSFIV